MDEQAPLTPTEFAKAAGVTQPFASLVLAGKRKMPRRVAIRVFQETGRKLGPIAEATDDEIAVLARFETDAAA